MQQYGSRNQHGGGGGGRAVGDGGRESIGER